MSKRTRGSRTARTRPASRPTPAPERAARSLEADSASSTASFAADVEATVEQERPVARPERAAARNGARAPGARQTGRSGGILAAKAADEYVYVSRDLRRITRFAGSIVAVMVALWLLIDVTKVIAY